MPAKKKTPPPAGKKAVKKKTTAKKPPVKFRANNKAVTKKKAVKKVLPFTTKQKNGPLCIVGIGASAGGLEALEGLFSQMPSDTNMAFVIIQHLAPKHKSIMGSLLQKYTGMEILQMQDGMKVEPNCMYLNPPDKDVSVLNGALYLSDPLETHSARLAIDFFFRSLAVDQRGKAICIILSGTGTDGTLGLKAVKGEGGMTMAQEEEQAKYDSMPRSAINTGCVDFILPVEKMPSELSKYVKHPYVKDADKPVTPKQEYMNTLNKIFIIIRSVTGHDFSNYKMNTIRRRIERRMAVHQIALITEYLRYLRENTSEIESLYKDMLITVTNFFRDPEAFDVLSKKTIPDLLKHKKPDSTLRIWVPGCATGEEAYSLAMLIYEAMDKFDKHLNLQIFATDIDSEAVEFARSGIYPDSIAADVSEKRLKRFFIKVDNTYSIKKQVRESVVFAVQNVIKDPPFSKLDLLSCRNVLIYMDSVLQKKILPLFHYVLNHNGILFLGTSESIGEFADYFSPVSTKWKVFKCKGISLDRIEHPALPFYDTTTDFQRIEDKKVLTSSNVRQLAEGLILQDYAPACVLLNDKHEIIYFHGKTDMFLSPPTGEPSFNILKMAREELRYSLSTLIHQAAKDKKAASQKALQIKHNNQMKNIDIIVRPLADKTFLPDLMMVIFEDMIPTVEPPVKKKKKPAVSTDQDPRVSSLEQELQSTKEYLQTTIEELETSNEELKSTNEELQSTNEELQSTNEEMETSKEELQSTNEELETVNSELSSKVEELSRANNDLNNLLASTEIGTIFLDTDLNISRFTPTMTRLFNLIQTDIGRPITDITSKTSYKDLSKDSQHVLDTLMMIEKEIEIRNDKWFQMRIMPYRTVDNVIDGVVITFFEVTELKQAREVLEDNKVMLEEKLQIGIDDLKTADALHKKEISERSLAENESIKQKILLEKIIQTIAEGITLSDAEGNYILYNKQMEHITGYSRKEASKSDFPSLLYPDPVYRKKALAEIKTALSGRDTINQKWKMRHKDGKELKVLISTRMLEISKTKFLLWSVRDITEVREL
jgi:two-component system CheB/CheR fusion protein